MAATARTTGADAQAEELRRRNVATNSTAPVVADTRSNEKETEKSKDKVWRLEGFGIGGVDLQGTIANQTTAVRHHLLPRRI